MGAAHPCGPRQVPRGPTTGRPPRSWSAPGAEVEGFLTGLEVVEPGVGEPPRWRGDEHMSIYGGCWGQALTGGLAAMPAVPLPHPGGAPSCPAGLGVARARCSDRRFDPVARREGEPAGRVHTPMLWYVTSTVALWAVELVGAGTKATVPVPEHGRSRVVGIWTFTA